MKSPIQTTAAPAAIGPYSQGIMTDNLAFISGQIPVNPESGKIEHDDIQGQARQSLQNLRSVLESAGFTMGDVVKTTCFITDINDFAKFNEVYEEFFTGDCPARSCVAVRELPKQALCEIEAIACK